jgi:hypothetical protein
MATHSLVPVRWLSEPRALSFFELTLAEQCQQQTARALVDGRRELPPGLRSQAELASLAE